jgi:hypothetical protein
MGALFSPWFWLGILIYGGIAASSGAIVMERIKGGEIAEIRAEAALQEVEAAKRAKVSTEKYTAENIKLGSQLAVARAARTKADKRLEENQREFAASEAGRLLAPPALVRLWNDDGAPAGDARNGANVRAAGPGSDAGTPAVALGDLPVAAAKQALGACREQVIGLQQYVKLLWAQIEDYVKGLAK